MRPKPVTRCLLALCLAGVMLPAAANDEVARRLLDMQQLIRNLDSRLARLESQMQNQAALSLLAQIEALKVEVAKLRGQVEVQENDISVTQKRQHDLYMDVDTRLRNLARVETASTAQPAAPARNAATPPDKPADPPSAAVDNGAEMRSYETALNLFKAGNYADAINAFKGFVKAYPDSALASSAQYWIGNAYFASKDFKSALAHQQKLIAAYPNSPKLPDAMLNIASAQLELGELAAARKTLETLIATYPASRAAELAKKRLAALK